jgi:rRNA processing protein Krr1/Pno1
MPVSTILGIESFWVYTAILGAIGCFLIFRVFEAVDETPATPTPAAPAASKKKKKSKAAGAESKGAPAKAKSKSKREAAKKAQPKKAQPKPEPVDSNPDEPEPVIEVKKSKKKKKSKGKAKEPTAILNAEKKADTFVPVPRPKAVAPVIVQEDVEDDDGWTTVAAVVRKPSKAKMKAKEQAAAAKNKTNEKKAPALPEDFLRVESRFHAMLCGPKFSTMNAIQEKSNTRVTVPKRDSGDLNFKITGSNEAIKMCKRCIIDLCEKGYSRLLTPDIVDSHIFVPVDKRARILGPGGAYRKALEAEYDVKIRLPDRSSSETRVYIVGLPRQAKAARVQIKSLLQYTYCAITHPGYVKAEIDLPQSCVGWIVGPRGSKIKSLQKDSGCIILVPDYISEQKLIVAGLPAGVARAQDLIGRILNPPQPKEQPQEEIFDEVEESDEDTAWAAPPTDIGAFDWVDAKQN